MKIIKSKIAGALALALALPVVAGAQSTPGEGQGNIANIIIMIEDLVAILIPVLVGIAVIVFIWGIIRYVLSKNAEDQAKAKGVMVWGVIALFVIVAIWGLIGFIARTFGINVNQTIKAPAVGGLNGASGGSAGSN